MLYLAILFFLDFIFYSLFDQQVVSLLLVNFVFILFFCDDCDFFSIEFKSVFILNFILLLIEDSFRFGRFGLSILYLLPLIFLFKKLQKIILFTRILPYAFLCSLFLSLFFIDTMIYHLFVPWYSTYIIILINLFVLQIFVGMRGSRSVLRFF